MRYRGQRKSNKSKRTLDADVWAIWTITHTDPNTLSSLSVVVYVFSPRLENKQRSVRENETERVKQCVRKQRTKRGKQAKQRVTFKVTSGILPGINIEKMERCGERGRDE